MADFAAWQKAPRLAAMAVTFAAALLFCGPALAAANPFDADVPSLGAGDPVPATRFTDQTGREFSFSSLRGRTAIVGFIYTRCSDECPLITAKFGALAQLLPGPFHLVELTLDPQHD